MQLQTVIAHASKAGSEMELAAHRDHYKDAGVDTDEAEAGLQRLTRQIMRTWPADKQDFGGVWLPIGRFANVINIGNGMGIAISTDGIGSKAMIASMLGKYDTVGIDCVAMNANDVICVGARPISMVDYFATDKVDADILHEISKGLSAGAIIANISICGGETSQLPKMVRGFDLVGTAIGHVPLNRILHGQNIEPGDAVIGVESSGVHSNGLTLARNAFFELNSFKISHRFDDLETDIGTELLRPTHIYVREAVELMDKISSLKALVHVTSDGFLNLTRTPSKVGYMLDNLPETPPIFRLIQKFGRVDEEEMYSVFNMGIGFCAVVGQDDVAEARGIIENGYSKFKTHLIGHVTDDPEGCVYIQQAGLRGKGKHFEKVRN
jgi:phosphoribosylformylglycinamidine cyclo-ligase